MSVDANRPGDVTAAAGVRPWYASASLDTLRTLLEAGVRVRQVVARRAGLTPSELTTLEHLSHGPLGPAALGRLLEVSSAAATGIVDRLAARGHVERVPHGRDRRRTEVHLTESGQTEMRRHLLPMFTGLAALEDQFDEAELAVVERYLRGALAAIDSVIDPAREQSGG